MQLMPLGRAALISPANCTPVKVHCVRARHKTVVHIEANWAGISLVDDGVVSTASKVDPGNGKGRTT